MLIYKITNKINGKLYIGQTSKTAQGRFEEHCKTHSGCRAIRNAIQKHGKENFTIEVIEECDTLEDCNVREQYWIKYYNSLVPNGYNLQTGGKNHTITDETRKLLSEAGKGEKNPFYGKKHTKEVIEYLRAINKGRSVPPEKLKRMSELFSGENNPFYGKKHTEETKRKLAEMRKKYTGTKHPRARAVLCVETGIVYPYIRKAQEETGVCECHISSCCRGKLPHAGGYHWQYVTERLGK